MLRGVALRHGRQWKSHKHQQMGDGGAGSWPTPGIPVRAEPLIGKGGDGEEIQPLASIPAALEDQAHNKAKLTPATCFASREDTQR